jgi:hypothetical protein
MIRTMHFFLKITTVLFLNNFTKKYRFEADEKNKRMKFIYGVNEISTVVSSSFLKPNIMY